MTASLLPIPVMRFVYPVGTALAGQPLAGGLVYTYAAGTSTPKTTYTDSTALTANPNPVVLDANGQASIWLSGAYKINVTDVNAVQIPDYPIDNVQDFFTADNITASSTTSIAITTGTQVFTTQANKYFAPGIFLLMSHNADPTKYMIGQVVSYVGTVLTMNVTLAVSTGTFADWTIALSGPPGATGPAGPSTLGQNSKSADYTTVLSDAGKHILHPVADNSARTFTIDANGTVAYPIGTTITFVNLINTVTISITTDTLILAGAGTTGNRTLAANGIATALKVEAQKWIIGGTGIT